MGVRVSLREVSAYRRFKIYSFRREIAGTQFGVHKLMAGVRLREVSISGGSTVL